MSELRVSPNVVATEFEDGEGVLVDLDSKRYYQLNETAMLIWKWIEERRTLDEIAAELQRVYEVTEEHARESIARTLRDLIARQLILDTETSR
jgi:hypothetical protein